jgi:hypothetical protein
METAFALLWDDLHCYRPRVEHHFRCRTRFRSYSPPCTISRPRSSKFVFTWMSPSPASSAARSSPFTNRRSRRRAIVRSSRRARSALFVSAQPLGPHRATSEACAASSPSTPLARVFRRLRTSPGTLYRDNHRHAPQSAATNRITILQLEHAIRAARKD